MRGWMVLTVIVALLAPPRAAQADELMPYAVLGYQRGRPRVIQVVQIGWAEVEVTTARAFREMQAAAAADGVTLFIRSGFRRQEDQQWLYEAWRAGWGNKAARPGHSLHQSGRALDLYLGEPATFPWLEANARKFGFKRTVPSEPWHWEFTKPPPKKMKKRRKQRARR